MLAVLQFDSASMSLLERLLAEDKLPALAELQRRGRWHRLATPASHFAAGAFHTLYSGVPLADHGLFYPFQWSAGEQRVRYMADLAGPRPIWEQLAPTGLRALVIDPYEGRRPRRTTGTVVSGWQFKDRVVLQRWSSPPAAGPALERLFGPPTAAEEIFGAPAIGELMRRRRQLTAAPGRVADAATLLMRRERYDVAWLTFSAAHIAGHQFWDLSQLAHRRLGDDARHVLGGALEQVYRAVDTAFERVLEALPAGTDLVVTSPVGMDVNTSRADMLPQMLDAVLTGRAADGPAGSIWGLRATLPPSVRAWVARLLPDRAALDLTARLETRGLDWSRVRAFALPADNQGYIRLNLRGRERLGIVDPASAPALMEEIAAGLSTFEDPDGARAVARVDRCRDSFAGAHADRLPDLVVHWRNTSATAIDRLASPRFGRVARRGRASGRSGNHTAGDAWALAIPGRGSAHAPLPRPADLVDVAATVAALAGESVAGGAPLLARPEAVPAGPAGRVFGHPN